MMTQSVKTQATNLFGNTAGSVSTKNKQTGSGFDLDFNNSLKSLKNPSGNQDAYEIKKTSVHASDKTSTVSDNSDRDTERVDKATDQALAETKNLVKNANTVQPEDEKTSGQTEGTKVSEEEIVVDDQVVAQISSLLQNVQQTVMETLNLTTEQFEQLLADQGMNISDLLQPENLQQFILASNGSADITAVLTDENLAATMKELLPSVEMLKSDAKLSLTTEQIQAILAKVKEAEELSKEQTSQIPIDTEIKVDVQENAEKQPIAEKQPKAENQPNAENQLEAINSMKLSGDENVNGNEMTTAKVAATQTTKADNAQQGFTGSQDNSGHEEQSELKTSDPFQNFVDNMVKTSKETQVDFQGNMVHVTELREIANQIIDRIKVSVTTDQTSMELQLNPENLGKVNFSVQSKNGVMTAQFVVQNEISKEAIESQLSTLRETLNSQGIKVEAIEVTVSSYAFGQNSSGDTNSEAQEQKDKSGKKITLEEAMSMTEMPMEEGTKQEMTGTLGSQIDYTA